MSKPINDNQMDFDDELATWFRVLLLDELIYNNGKTLDSKLIGDITASVTEKVRERLKRV